MQVIRYQAVQMQRIESRTHRPLILSHSDEYPEPHMPAECSTEVGADQPGSHVQPWGRSERIAAGLLLLACVVIVVSAVASKLV